MEFQVALHYTVQMLADYQRLVAKGRRWTVGIMLVRLLFGALGLLLAVGGPWLITRQRYVPGVVGAALALLLLFVAVFFYRYTAWESLRRLNQEERSARITFGEEALTVSCSFATTTVAYASLTWIYESRAYYLLGITKKKGWPLQKAAFVEGDPEAFRAFLEEKSGKQVVQIQD